MTFDDTDTPDEPLDDVDYWRPQTRADCLAGGENAERPCPFVGCRHHLGLHLTIRGLVRPVRPEVLAGELGGLAETCSLDVAEAGTHSLEECGQLLGCTRERVRQISNRGLGQFRRNAGPVALSELEDALRDREAAWTPACDGGAEEEPPSGPGSVTAVRAAKRKAVRRITKAELERVEAVLEAGRWRTTSEVARAFPRWVYGRARSVLVHLYRTGRVEWQREKRKGEDGGGLRQRSEWRLRPRDDHDFGCTHAAGARVDCASSKEANRGEFSQAFGERNG